MITNTEVYYRDDPASDDLTPVSRVDPLPVADASPSFDELAYGAFETLTVSSTGLALTRASEFESAYITTETDSIRFRLDGVSPTATVGHLVSAGGQIILTGSAEVRGFRVIRVSTDATLRVSYANRVA